MAIPLIFKRIAIIFYIQAIKLRFLWSKKEDDYFLVTPLFAFVRRVRARRYSLGRSGVFIFASQGYFVGICPWDLRG